MTNQTSWILTPVPHKDDPLEWDFTLPKEEMAAAGWQEGDPLAWQDNEDGTWTVSLKIIRQV